MQHNDFENLIKWKLPLDWQFLNSCISHLTLNDLNVILLEN